MHDAKVNAQKDLDIVKSRFRMTSKYPAFGRCNQDNSKVIAICRSSIRVLALKPKSELDIRYT